MERNDALFIASLLSIYHEARRSLICKWKSVRCVGGCANANEHIVRCVVVRVHRCANLFVCVVVCGCMYVGVGSCVGVCCNVCVCVCV